MHCFVTGATGFIGANLVRELNERGHEVRALVRPQADLRGLAGARWEPVAAALTDRVALAGAMRGCEWCFHVAASYHLWLPDYAPLYEANVEGTRAVLEAARDAGCQRVVYTSTVGVLRPPPPQAGKPSPVDEGTLATLAEMTNPYKRSKWLAEEVARNLAGQGLPVVIVNPTAPVGPRDAKPTPTGQVIVDFLNRAMPAFLDTGLNWAHVRDVAVGHILAAERGRIGERYILGNEEGNWTLQEALQTLAELTGLPAPRWRIPYVVAYLFACLDEAKSRWTRRPPRAPLAGVRMARYKMFFTAAKAVRELGLPQTPPREGLDEAVQWFRANGLVKTRV
jgi:dihydroflavonol-4-reductase